MPPSRVTMPKIVAFRTDPRFVRRAREIATIAAMIRMYCRGHHGEERATTCAECASLLAYASRRTERCVFGDAKPTCANCQVHCYTQTMRERVRAVMRWSGPRMLFTHLLLALRHKLDGLRPAPLLPTGSKAQARE
jgi:Nitrous oxide-stimulated promoter